MKQLDQFVQQMMESAKLVRSNNPGAATDVIQRALQQAGLMAPATATATVDDAPGMIDLNPAPGFAGKPAAPRARAARALPKTAGAFKRKSAPPADLGPGRFIDGTFSCSAGQRRYKLYIPARAATGPRPLVVMLHGCTQDARDFAAGTAMNSVAEEHNCLVLYPEQERSANANGCWNWFEPGQQRRGSGEPAIIAGMARQVAAEHGGDASKVFAAGLSAGGAMAAILGAEYPDLFAAVGVHSGLAAGTGKDMISGLHAMKRAPQAATAKSKVPVIVFHGDADHVVNADNGDAVLRQFADAHGALTQEHIRGDAAGRGYSRTSWRNAQGQRIAEHWLIHGAAHAWMGGKAAGSHTDATGPNASKEMLAFFLEQRP
ncbi:extracellular catalytic domain type 1 short-chain-length polyhydroxyalkanoate depolymerase [Massilia yuzhufengensis]|uniref:Esterase, PHB depolymerase family n=1 Tax=Massilia yuzhufengensis TaxID=1164594 RepID=A0A1I1EUQ4_9BURK|nr:PHB depolymerase family esterase [Massilia yuzhufengensis]SFB88653.1 esterase, PHB depolymerase family [Massilia yuzhufengensis]